MIGFNFHVEVIKSFGAMYLFCNNFAFSENGQKAEKKLSKWIVFQFEWKFLIIKTLKQAIKSNSEF